MNRLFRASVFALITVAAFFAPALTASAQEPITVEGRLINGTPDGGSVEGVTVTFHHESQTVHTHMEYETDEQGRFKFDGIEFDPAASYGVSTQYQGVLYGVDLDLSNGSPPPATIDVFDTTSDQNVLEGGSSSLLFAATDKAAQVVAALEIIRIVNNSDYTYVPGNNMPMDLIRFGLPPGSRGLNVDTRLIGGDFVQVDRGFALLSSVPPGSHQIMYTYEFPYEESQYVFTKNYRYGATNLRILAPEEVLDISSLQLGSTESITIGERPYRLIQASSLPRNTEVTVDLTGLPKATFGEKVGQTVSNIRLEYVAPVGLGIVMVSLIAIALIRKRRKNNLRAAMGEIFDDTVESQTLRHMIADLESSFEAGIIGEDDYLRRRRLLEARLSSAANS